MLCGGKPDDKVPVDDKLKAALFTSFDLFVALDGRRTSTLASIQKLVTAYAKHIPRVRPSIFRLVYSNEEFGKTRLDLKICI